MIPAIKAEFRKLITVRSTYVVLFIATALVAFTALYIEGYWGKSGSAAGSLMPSALNEIVANTAGAAALFISIIAVLQTGHEYRHNTIMYTLTASARRTKVYLAKVFVIAVFSVLAGLLISGFGIVMYYAGLALRDASLPAQDFALGTQVLRVTVYSFVYGMVGLLLTLLVRHLIGAIVALMIVPSTVEPLLSLLLKDNSVYLPFSAFDHITGAAMVQGKLTPNAAIVVSLAYIGALGLITWLLFLRRDAN